MPPIDLSSASFGYLLCVEFSWWTEVRRFCRSPSAQIVDGLLYSSLPELEVDYSQQDGGIEDSAVGVTVRSDIDPIWKMLTQTHAEVTVRLLEADQNDLSATPRVAFVGTIGKTRSNYRGRTRLVRADVNTPRRGFKDVSLGLKATDRCSWIYGSAPCGAPVVTTLATVTSVSGTSLVFTTLPNNDPIANVARYTRGFVEFEGLRIMVRSHDIISKTLTLAKPAPQIVDYTWSGKAVTVGTGCTKTIEACTARGQAANFMGIGRAMPQYNPIIEDSPTGGA